MSQKFAWKEVKTANESSSRPSPRWGHSSCLIGDEFVLFGGYADSIYMNDVWSFNTSTLEWKEIQTHGNVPSPRSNTTMNYDSVNQRLIIFGGGGNNKLRFSEVNILDWQTKEWSSIQPQQTQPCPWERTYHSAELIYPYLIVFGGEGVSDLDDLWVFNMETSKWSEIIIDSSSVRPCGRRFHSSCLVNNRLYIIAGCHAKYRLLHDVFSIDLTPLKQTGTTEGLVWKEQVFKEQGFLARWGHATAVLQNNIYIFGGRFSDDLNDVLVINTETNSLKILKVANENKPKPRRRACLTFVGNCMLMFGGFNAYYYNDLFYINVTENVLKPRRAEEVKEQMFSALSCRVQAMTRIRSKDGYQFECPKGLIAQYFQSKRGLQQFLKAIELQQSYEDLKELLEDLQKGYGKSKLLRKYFQEDSSEKSEKINNVSNAGSNFRILRPRCEAIQPPCKYEGRNSQVLVLSSETYNQFKASRSNYYYDLVIQFKEDQAIHCNTVMLLSRSKFFRNLFSSHFRPSRDLGKFNLTALGGQGLNFRLMQIVVDYLETDYLIIPQQFALADWFSLYQLADYMVLGSVKKMVLQDISASLTKETKQQIMSFAVSEGLEDLAVMCGRYILSRNPHLQFYPSRHMNQAYQQLRFQLKQAQTTRTQSRVQTKPSLSSMQEEDKENIQNCR